MIYFLQNFLEDVLPMAVRNFTALHLATCNQSSYHIPKKQGREKASTIVLLKQHTSYKTFNHKCTTVLELANLMNHPFSVSKTNPQCAQIDEPVLSVF